MLQTFLSNQQAFFCDQVIFNACFLNHISSSSELLLILPMNALLTAGFAQQLWHIARASFSPMLPNIVLTRSQLGMAEPRFKPTTLWLDIWSGFKLHFLAAQACTAPDGSDRPTAIVSKVVAKAQIEFKSYYKPQQPQPSSNISFSLAYDYSPCKGKILY